MSQFRMLLSRRYLATAALLLPLASARISEPPINTNTKPTSWITTAGLTIANDAWDWQQYLIADAFSGVPSSEFSTCSSDYIGSFLDWASIYTSDWTTYGTEIRTDTEWNSLSTDTTTETITYYQPLGEGIDGFSYQYVPPCCGWCQVIAPSVQLYYWQNLTSPNETITSTAVIDNKYTVTYPSAFVLFDSVYTADYCTYNSTFYTELGYEMNTDSMSYMLQGVRTSGIGDGNLGYTALPFNYWQQSSLCSSMVAQGTSSFEYLHTTISNTLYGFLPCYPAISAPDALFSAVPGWGSCAQRDIWYQGSYDPPHTLTPQSSLEPTTSAVPASQPTPPAAETTPFISINSPRTSDQSKAPTSVPVLPVSTMASVNGQDQSTQVTDLPIKPTGRTSVVVAGNANQPSENPTTGLSSSPEAIASPQAPNSQDPSDLITATLLQLGSSTFSLLTNPAGSEELAGGTITISEGGPAATIDGTFISLGSSDLVIGTRTQTWDPSATAAIGIGPQIGGAILSAWTAAGGLATTDVSFPTSTSTTIAVGSAPSKVHSSLMTVFAIVGLLGVVT